MKFKIDGSYVNGTDIGHPDGVDIFTACCCGFVAGDTSEKRDANARLVVAAPEMLDFLHTARTLLSTVAVAASWNDDTIKQLVPECRAFMAASNKLLDKIKGGGE